MIEYLFCAFRNLGRKKFRTFLTVMGITIGVASVIVIGSIGESGRASVSNELESLGIDGLNVSTKNSSDSVYDSTAIDQDDVKDCLKINGVTSAMPMIMQSGNVILHGKEKGALYWGIGSDARNIISMSIIHGSMLSKRDVDNKALLCLVDDTFAKAFFKRENVTGEKITVFLGDDYQQLTIKGVVESGSSLLYNLVGSYMPYFIYLPYTTAEDLRGENGYDQIAVKTASSSDIDTVGQNIVTMLTNNHTSTEFIASNMFRQKQRLSNLLNIVTLVISAVGAISLLVAGLGIMTVMTVSVSERKREIGIKMAIGAKRRLILLEFLFEAISISLLGVFAGTALGSLISYIGLKVMNMPFSFNLGTILISSGFAVFVGILFGVFPAVKASRLKPVDALMQT